MGCLHGAQVVGRVVKAGMDYLEQTQDRERRVALISTLRDVTEGRVRPLASALKPSMPVPGLLCAADLCGGGARAAHAHAGGDS